MNPNDYPMSPSASDDDRDYPRIWPTLTVIALVALAPPFALVGWLAVRVLR